MLRQTTGEGDASDHDVIDVNRLSDQPQPSAKTDGGQEFHARQRESLKRHQPSEKQAQAEDDAQNDDDDDDDDDAGQEHTSVWEKLRQHKIAVAITIVLLIAAIVAGIIWYLNARHFENTDDAFIDGRPVALSPDVSGNIVAVSVNDNQLVKSGDLLAEIDPRDYRAAVALAVAQIEQAEASIMTSQAQVDAQKAQIDQAKNQVDQAKASLSFAKDQDVRAQKLVNDGAGTVQNAQQTASTLKSSLAAYDAAIASQTAAERQIDVLQAQIRSAKAQLAQAQAHKATAEANLTRTQLHATLDGRVTRLTAAVGAAATPGQALMVLVPTALWVTANFKETQLTDMRPGQPVDIEIDAYGRTYPGHVDSIQSGSGTAFSLLPAENATGNYVKVVQRVPVKLTFDQLPDVEIGPGMSVVPSVRVR